ncbi:MAG: hypothetical protein KKF08_18930, partial [Gammaproteobacteria bacterium]|nr:hypothetical protein [Gammaproteobacteria bacterium]
FYRDAAIEMRVPGYSSRLGLEAKPTLVYTHPRYGRIGTYGGKLVENYVQALCRDLLAESLVYLEEAGFPVVMHVHDEVVVEMDSPEQLDEVGRIMVRRPDWAQGLHGTRKRSQRDMRR